MTGTAVVTGSAGRVADVAQAFERRGVTVVPLVRGEKLAASGVAQARGPLEYYVQLPDDVASPGSTRAGALAALFGRGLMSRFSEVEFLLPQLASNCAVILVTGETVDDLLATEYPHAPTCLLELLADAITVDRAPTPVRTTVLSHWHSADRIAEIALASGPGRGAAVAGFASRAPEMSFDDWRLACLSTNGPEV